MSELDNKIRQISDLLSDQNAQESIQKIIQSFAGNPDSSNSLSQQTNNADNELDDSQASGSTAQEDPMPQISDILTRIGSNQDSRVNLLRSVQPFLRGSRQARCKTCINVLRIVDVLRLVSRMEK